jgi:hypothetical protein
MNTNRLFAAAALISAFLAGPALAQPGASPSSDMTSPTSSRAPVNPPAPGAPSASDAAVAASAVARDPGAPLGSAANPIPQNSPTHANEAYALVAGDPTVISNGPVPDTEANRAKYGQPLSATGRASRPAGN